MRYFVIGEDGQLYGPADVATLNEWIGQGRLFPTTMIMEEFGGARFAASLLKELNFPPGHATQQSTPPGENDVRIAWLLGLIGCLCCNLLGPIGLAYGIIAYRKKHPKAKGAILFCALVIAISIAWAIYLTSIGGIDGLTKILR